MSYEAEDTLKDPGTNDAPDADVRNPSGTDDDEAGSGAGDPGPSSPGGGDEDDAAG